MILTYGLESPISMGAGFDLALPAQAADPTAGETTFGPQGGRPVAQAAGPFAMPGREIRDNGFVVLTLLEPFGHLPRQLARPRDEQPLFCARAARAAASG